VRSSDAAHPGTEKILTQAAGVGVEVTALDGAEDLVGALSSLGFSASIYELSYDKEGVFPEDHQAIWIGYLIAPDVVMLAIKTALKQWPFLRYLHLSQDSGGPDDTHRQIYFGGSTGTAVGRYELVSWSVDELNGIPDGIGIEKFHKLIRDKYTKDTREA
jgi:hypothetical protein